MIRPFLLAAGLGLGAGPLLAEAHIDTATMTCADYLAMDAEGQAAAADALGKAAEAMGHGMADANGEAMMTGDALTAHVATMCSQDGMADMVAADAMMAGG